ncbi:hypothetical protein C8J33_101715 [Rhizobium sp. PP-CC-3G-465]|nr:hypothetical protein C8J33_101715 [Rhizobium sp. PP-CC-3G-465]
MNPFWPRECDRAARCSEMQSVYDIVLSALPEGADLIGLLGRPDISTEAGDV